MPDRQGTAWSLEDCGQLVEGVRNGQTAGELASLLGRTEAAVRAQARRLAPPGTPVKRDDALEWLAARLVDEEDYDWRKLFESHRRMSRGIVRKRAARTGSVSPNQVAITAGGVADHPAVRPASVESLHRVLEDWQRATGHALNDERRAAFFSRSEVSALAHVDSALRASAAARLWTEHRRLLVAEWLAESLHSGGVSDDDESSKPRALEAPQARPHAPNTEGVPSPDEIESARTPAGGWTREQLAAWGVPWPAPKGWRSRLEARWHAARRASER